jgi:aryl-alcohol dehydrogenase-like predicted oxidoreductase
VDCLFLHNLDAFRLARGREEYRQTFASCVEVLEELVLRGWIDAYGVSAWSGFRQMETAPDYLSLADLRAMAQAIAGSAGHFRFVQAPVGLWAPEAILLRNQVATKTEGLVSLLRAAHNLGLTVIANPESIRNHKKGLMMRTPEIVASVCRSSDSRIVQDAWRAAWTIIASQNDSG